MKKTLILSILTFGLLTSCTTNGGGGPALKEIELSGTYQTTFAVNEEFNYDGLVVIAHYSDHSIQEVSDYTVSTPDMTAIGNQDVTVTYKNKSKSYSIFIHSVDEVAYPVSDAVEFLSSRGVSASSGIIPTSIASLVGVLSSEIIEDEYPYFKVEIDNDDSYESIVSQLGDLNYDTSGDIYIDPTETIGLKVYKSGGHLVIQLYAYNDLIEVPPEEEDEGEKRTIDFPLQNNGYIRKDLDLDGKTYTFNDFSFKFLKNGSTTPKSEQSQYVALYTNNTLQISTKYAMKKITFTLLEGTDKTGPVTSDVGSVSNHIWTGKSTSVTFTAVAQYRFVNIQIEYMYKEGPVIEGVKTIQEIYDFAKDYEYTPSVAGWYLTNNVVTMKIKAIDAIDSVTTSGLYPAARGKVLCVDNTGYIIVSSGVSRSNPVDFYQRVKDNIENDNATYIVTGKIAFFNDVVEINVTSYQYDSSLEIEYDLNNYLTSDTVNSSDSFMNHCKTIKTNKNGYGVGEIVRLNGLTYFNKYRKAGSYYFLDREGKLVPIYSFQDKDRSLMVLGNTYDIIGFETMYNGRPSLRILKVIKSELDPVEYDLNNAIEKEDTAYFYNVNPGKEAYAEEYFNSVTTVYKMTVYVSRYTDDKYTFNVNYHYDYTLKEYTTGYSQADAANHNSVAMSNENLDYNQTFYDYALELAESEEGIEEYKVTIYFTLALLETVSGKEMWKANVFEEYVPQLGV